MTKTALITGASGQDGSFLTEQLLARDYTVFALDRARSDPVRSNLRNALGHPNFRPVDGDLLDTEQLSAIIRQHQPDELYNLAAQSFVAKSWDSPIYTSEINALGPLRILEAIRRYSDKTRFYQATSSEVYGKVAQVPQDEETTHHPRSPYGVAKSFGMNITRNYRESFGLFACNGILFNHESERRGPHFVTRKITMAVAAIHAGRQSDLRIGNMDAKRDWGYAPDYVRAMQMILGAQKPDDFVIATGQLHSIREFIEFAFTEVGLTISWNGTGVNETGTDQHGIVRVRVDPSFFRPADVELVVGNARKAHEVLGWRPTVNFQGLVRRMVQHDLQELAKTGTPVPALKPSR